MMPAMKFSRSPRAQRAAFSPTLDSKRVLEHDFKEFLLQERGLALGSADRYLEVARRFLSFRCSMSPIPWQRLDAKGVIDFVLHDSSDRGRRSAQLMTAALRSLLRFLFQTGRINANLVGAVPTVAGGPRSELPTFLEANQVRKLLRGCDRRCKVGKRDYAILLILSRLGLRAGEVAALVLEDIDWSGGSICVRGKGSRVDRLPLVEEVGQALADYVRKGRPICSSRRVFLRSVGLPDGFSGSSGVSAVVRRALRRAGLQAPHQGAHLLRHSLATNMLQGGATLAEISQVLRHQHIHTTEVYAKIDFRALRALSQPWLGGVQ
jgi:site-specific recombinase XerD